MRRILSALVAVLIATGTCVAIDEINPRKLRRATASSTRGFQALEQGDLSLASQFFEDALKNVRGFPNARVGLGHVAYARQQYEAALVHYTGARDEFRRLLHEALNSEFRRHEQAQRKILKLEDDIRTLQSLPNANVADQIRELQRGIEDLRRVHRPVQRAPAEPPAEIFYHRGNTLFQLGRLDEALVDWETCARLAPRFAAVHNNLAVVRWKLGHLLIARAELARARELGAKVNPQFEEALDGARLLPPRDPPLQP